MPPLANPKHELFAHELAKGRTQVEAYAKAGYKPNDGHAARLAGDGRIAQRVLELQTKVAAKVEVTMETILLDLEADRQFARENGSASAAVTATMGKAKVAGLIIDKAEVKLISELTDAEVEAELASLIAPQTKQLTAH